MLLLSSILVMTTLPALAAFYFVDRTLQTSLNLGFNERVTRALDIASASLKRLKRLDPPNESQYRTQFEAVEELRPIYQQPQWVRERMLGPLRSYFALGLAASVLLAVLVGAFLSRLISRSYHATLEELIAQRERVRDLEQMASWQELARILAHEIKNPLTPIEVLVTSLPQSYERQPPEQFAALLERTRAIIADELAHLKRTMNRFSDFARLPAAQLIEGSVPEVIERQLPVIGASFGEVAVQLRANAERSRLRARVDASLLRQVLVNIIGNGVEANPRRRIAFAIDVSASAESVQITIANDGEPVLPAIAAHLFDPYVSGTAGPDNMGLGLTIVKKIVLEHGGTIRYAERNGGPCFTISLPRVH
jgi:signal transduction histidine kinase